jgi:hypothetical protein
MPGKQGVGDGILPGSADGKYKLEIQEHKRGVCDDVA